MKIYIDGNNNSSNLVINSEGSEINKIFKEVNIDKENTNQLHEYTSDNIVNDDSNIVNDDSNIVNDDSNIVNDDSNVVDDNSNVVDDDSNVVDDDSNQELYYIVSNITYNLPDGYSSSIRLYNTTSLSLIDVCLNKIVNNQILNNELNNSKISLYIDNSDIYIKITENSQYLNYRLISIAFNIFDSSTSQLLIPIQDIDLDLSQNLINKNYYIYNNITTSNDLSYIFITNNSTNYSNNNNFINLTNVPLKIGTLKRALANYTLYENFNGLFNLNFTNNTNTHAISDSKITSNYGEYTIKYLYY